MIGLDVILQAGLSGLFMGSVYALIAIGFTLVFGVTNIVNFAHGNFVMAAMFVTYLLFKTAHVDPYLGLVVVLPLFFGFGALVYALVIRRIVDVPHSAHMMVTLGLLIFLENLANLFFGGDLRGITTSYTTSSLVVGAVCGPHRAPGRRRGQPRRGGGARPRPPSHVARQGHPCRRQQPRGRGAGGRSTSAGSTASPSRSAPRRPRSRARW